MTNKGFGTKPEIPSHYKTVEEVINQYCPDVWDMIKKKNGIKRTGSLDEIPMKKRKEIKKVLKIYINIKALDKITLSLTVKLTPVVCWPSLNVVSNKKTLLSIVIITLIN